MYISRDKTIIIHHILDQWLPPVVRDSRWFMYPFFLLLFGKQAKIFMDFKKKAPDMNESEIRKVYLETAPYNISRNTDINRACLNKIEQSLLGLRVLDVACGKGFLIDRLSGKYKVTGADLVIDMNIPKKSSGIEFHEVDICRLPFADNQFDTVISAHTLEHIPNINKAVLELRRVSKHRLIIILPRQRPYKYTFDLHLHFFPYAWSVEHLMGERGFRRKCSLVGGDWFYLEDQ